MIEAGINYLNSLLTLTGYFDKSYCLAELKSEGDSVFPVHYVSDGNWEKIKIDQFNGVSYWRKDAEITSNQIPNELSTDILYQTTIPLKLVAYKRRGDVGEDDGYTADRLADVIKKQLTFVNGPLRSTIKARKVNCTVTNSGTNSAAIYAEEYNPAPSKDIPFKWVVVSMDIDLVIEGTRDCMDSCPTDFDVLHSFDFCDQSTFDRLTTAQKACLTTELCVACADATVENNATPTWSETVASGATLTLDQAKMLDSDGTTTVLADYIPNGDGFMFTATPCALVPSTTVNVYSDVGLTLPITEADWGDTVCIKVIGADITPTAYRFVTVPSSGDVSFTEQVGQSLAYTITTLGTLDIYGIATDGTGAPSNPVKFELTINADADAVAFINAHNTATGLSMAIVQQTAVFNLVSALKGTGTPNGSDLWTCFDSSTSEIYIYCPVSDAVATAAAYQIDLIDPTVDAVLTNFTGGDISTLGVTSGTGKYLAMKRAPNTFGQDDVSVHVYPRTSSVSAISMEIGSINAASWTGIGVSLWPRWSAGIAMHCNSGYSLTGTYSDGQGLLSVQRDNSANMQYYQDGVQIGTAALASSAPIAQTFYGHATKLTTGVGYEGTNQLALVAATCSLTANERADWYFAIDQYQTQVITGGRNV